MEKHDLHNLNDNYNSFWIDVNEYLFAIETIPGQAKIVYKVNISIKNPFSNNIPDKISAKVTPDYYYLKMGGYPPNFNYESYASDMIRMTMEHRI